MWSWYLVPRFRHTPPGSFHSQQYSYIVPFITVSCTPLHPFAPLYFTHLSPSTPSYINQPVLVLDCCLLACCLCSALLPACSWYIHFYSYFLMITLSQFLPLAINALITISLIVCLKPSFTISSLLDNIPFYLQHLVATRFLIFTPLPI